MTKYDEKFHPKDLLDKMSNGKLDVQIYSKWKIGESTFYKWKNEHEELQEAWQKGKAAYESWFIEERIDKLIDGSLDGKHSYKATELLAKNKLSYKNRDQEETVTNTTNNIQINVLESTADLVKKINNASQKWLDRGVELPYLKITNDKSSGTTGNS